jgi:hypothetical protein
MLYEYYVFLEELNDIFKKNIRKFKNINIIININNINKSNLNKALTIIKFSKACKIPFYIINNYQMCIKYGAKGIKVCDAWRKFLGFWTDMSVGYSDDLQIDRIDGTKGYSKENCRWATVKQQQRNRKSNHTIETPKGPMLVIEASEAFGIPVGCLSMRIRSWPQLRWFEPKRPHVRRPL